MVLQIGLELFLSARVHEECIAGKPNENFMNLGQNSYGVVRSMPLRLLSDGRNRTTYHLIWQGGLFTT